MTLSRMDKLIEQEKRERALSGRKSQTRVEQSKSNAIVSMATEEGLHSYHFKNLETLSAEQRTQVLQSYYISRALENNKTIKKLTMCSHLPYGNSFYHPASTPK